MAVDVASLRVRIAAEGIDKASRDIAQLGREIGGVPRSADGAARSLKAAGDSATGLGTSSRTAGGHVAQLGGHLTSSTGKFAKFAGEAAKGVAMGAGFAAFNTVMAGVDAAIGFVGDSVIGLNSRLEQAEIGFTTMLGSAEAADVFLRDLGDFAARTPFEFPELVQASQRMLAMGFAAGDVEPLLTAIGDAVAAVGGSSELVDRVTIALGQMQSKTKVSAEEMLQLTEAGIPAWQLLADHIGVSVAEVQKMSSQGQIAADVMITAFHEFSTQNFGGMMEAQSHTFQGAMSTIQDSLSMALATGARPFFDMLADGADQLAQFTSGGEFQQWAEDVAQKTEEASDELRDFLSEHKDDLIGMASDARDAGVAFSDLAVGIGEAAVKLDEFLSAGGDGDMFADLVANSQTFAKIIKGEAPTEAEWRQFLGAPDDVNDAWVNFMRMVGGVSDETTRNVGAIEQAIEELSGGSIVSLQDFETKAGVSFANVNGVFLYFTGQTKEAYEHVQEFASQVGQAEPVVGMYGDIVEQTAVQVDGLTDAHDRTERSQHRLLQTAAELGVSVDDLRAAYHPLTMQMEAVEDAAEGLASAYQTALGVQQAFTSQGSEYASTQGAIEKAVEAVQEKQRAGIPLSEAEINLLDQQEEALGRLAGGQQDATVEAGLAALAASELMLAQDELNKAIADGVEDLTPYKQRVDDAKDALGFMGDAAGNTQDAQGDLAAAIQGPLLGAIGDLTRAVEYVSKPWLIEIDAATDAAEREVQRLKDIIALGATMPISIVSGDASGILPGGADANFQHGGISQGGMALVGERGPEMVVLPKGAEVIPNHRLPFLGGFAEGTSRGGGGGGGNAEGTGRMMGADFASGFVTEALEILGGLAEGFTADWLEHTRLFLDTAQAAFSTFDAEIDLSIKVAEFEAGGGTLPGSEIVAQLADFSATLTQAVGDSAALFEEEFLTAAGAYASAAKSGIDLISAAVDTATSLGDFTVNLESATQAASDLKFLTESIVLFIGDSAAMIESGEGIDHPSVRGEGFVGAADAYAQGAKSAVELIGAAADALSGLDEFEVDMDAAKNAASNLKFLVEEIVLFIGDSAAIVNSDVDHPSARGEGFVGIAGDYAEGAQKAVALVAEALSFISQLSEFEGEFNLDDAKRFASDLKFLSEHVAISIAESAALWNGDVNPAVLSFTEAAGTSLALMGDAAGALEIFSGEMDFTLITVQGVEDRATALGGLARIVAEGLILASAAWPAEVNPAIETFASAAGSSLGLMADVNDALELLTSEFDFSTLTVAQVQDIALSLGGLARIVAEAFIIASANWDQEATPAIQSFADAAGASLGLISDTLDVIEQLTGMGEDDDDKKKKRFSSFREGIDALASDIRYTVDVVADMAEDFEGSVEDWAAFADAAGKSVNLVGDAADAFDKIVKMSAITEEHTGIFVHNFQAVLDLVGILDDMAQDYVDDAITFNELMEEIAAAMHNAAEVIDIAAGTVGSSATNAAAGGGAGSPADTTSVLDPEAEQAVSPISGGGGPVGVGAGTGPLDLAAAEYKDAQGVMRRLLAVPGNIAAVDLSDWIEAALAEGNRVHLIREGAIKWGMAEMEEVKALFGTADYLGGRTDRVGFMHGGYTLGEVDARLHPGEYITPEQSVPQLAREIVAAITQGGYPGGQSEEAADRLGQAIARHLNIEPHLYVDSQSIANSALQRLSRRALTGQSVLR